MKYKIFKKAIAGMALGALASAMMFGAAEESSSGIREEISQEYVNYCQEAGEKYKICPELLEAIIETESNGNPDAVGGYGEIGLMQIYLERHEERAERLGASCVKDPRGNIFLGTDYLAELFLEHGDLGTALMAYNGTRDAADRGDRGDYTDYAKEIMERARQLERLHGK